MRARLRSSLPLVARWLRRAAARSGRTSRGPRSPSPRPSASAPDGRVHRQPALVEGLRRPGAAGAGPHGAGREPGRADRGLPGGGGRGRARLHPGGAVSGVRHRRRRRARRDQRAASTGCPGTIASDFSVYANVSWEIDLWGRLRRSTESARAELLATEAARQGGDHLGASQRSPTCTSSCGTSTTGWRSRSARWPAAGTSLDLIRTRFSGGIVSELDVRQAEIEEATAAAAVPAFERSIARSENALSVLLGRPPRPDDARRAPRARASCRGARRLACRPNC